MIFPSKPPFIVVVHGFFLICSHVSPMLFSYVPMVYSVFFPHVPLVFLCFSRISPFPSPVGSPRLRTMTGRPERAAHPGPTSWAHDVAQWRPRRSYCGTWVMRLGKKTDLAIGKWWFVWGLWWFMANWWWQNGDLTIGKWWFNHQKFGFNTDLMGFMANWWWQT